MPRTQKLSKRAGLLVAAIAALSIGIIVLEARADDEDFECDGDCEFDEGIPRILIRKSNNWHYTLLGPSSGDSPGTYHCYQTEDGTPTRSHIRTDGPGGGTYRGHVASNCHHQQF